MSYTKQYDIGIIGLALLRNWLVGDDKKAYRIIQELRTLLDKNKDELLQSNSFDVHKGYKKWSEVYDTTPNLLIEVEEPAVKTILRNLTPGKALDAACGTGRYSKIMKEMKFDVTGMDLSKDMLRNAKTNVPGVNFVVGNLENIPFDDESFDIVLSALALTHLNSLNKAVAELSRITKKGGHIILSDIHPWITLLGGQANFYDVDKNYSFIRNYVHWHSNYLESFKQSNLRLLQCLEPTVKKRNIDLAGRWFSLERETIAEAFEKLPLALVWELEKI